MENSRDIDQVLMSIRNSSGTIMEVALFSANMSFRLLIYLMRLVKKGLVAASLGDRFKAFTKETGGKFTVYNIPISAERADKISRLNSIELKLQKERNPWKKRKLKRELKKLQGGLPELTQLKKLNIRHCVLPKLNGSMQTVQIAVSNRHDQMFKNWFLNHLTTGLSGGAKKMEDIRVFTEGNMSIYNLPFEGEEFEAALSDFEVLGMNYSVLPDLKVGDGNRQIAVPNADRSKLEAWFKMWKEKQLKEGKEVGELYTMDEDSYADTGCVETDEYIEGSEPEYKAADAEFEENSEEMPWSGKLKMENSEEYMRYLQNDNYERITIAQESFRFRIQRFFYAYMPYTEKYNSVDGQKEKSTLILSSECVFQTKEGKTYVAFIPKNKKIMVANQSGGVSEYSFEEVYSRYEKIERNLKKIQDIRNGVPLEKSAKAAKTADVAKSTAKAAAGIKAPVPKIPKL